MSYGWVSNNSIYAELGMDYTNIQQNITTNGEPGLLWLQNMKEYSRMCDPKDYRDRHASGGNPCLEQTLESFELCCLVETFPNHHQSLTEFTDTLKYALLYAKIVTLGNTHWKESNIVMNRNRRIGVSMTGIAQFLNTHGINSIKLWSEKGYKYLREFDSELSNLFKVPESIKLTSIKPSGTVSLLGGATPGIHYPHSRFYIRRVRLASDSPLVEELKLNGYDVEADVMQPDSTMVVSFPIDIGEGVKTEKNVGMWEQISLAAFMQKYWADNQVSCTVSFDKKEARDIVPALDYFQYQLKGISFLPKMEIEEDGGSPYPQMPYEEIGKEKYDEMIGRIKVEKLRSVGKIDEHVSSFCDNDKCEI